jgi:crossover junction endodeoxyribonuclease RuvC
MKILGIDPGIGRVGWGIIFSEKRRLEYIACGCITTSKDLSQQERIGQICRELRALIQQHSPDTAVVERLFFAKNKKTAFAVSEARGAILMLLDEHKITTIERTPLEVKMAITGNGRAEKHQVAWVVKNILKIPTDITSDDALDALALCLMAK